jgi:hypothetical protein
MAESPDWDARPSIRLTNTIMENPKIVGLTDKAFRAFIGTLCYCSRQETDGKIIRPAARVLATPAVLRELVTAGLLEVDDVDYRIHDYLKHQRSSDEIAAFRASRSEDGKLGAHLRWHVPRRQKAKGCDYCLKGVQSA